MNNKNLIYVLVTIIWLLVIALWVCYYSHQTSQYPSNWIFWWWEWTWRRFWSWSRIPWWSRMWSWAINNFSAEDKVIIDELMKARKSWDKNKEKELMDKLRNKKAN